jgi:hypothetical protein
MVRTKNYKPDTPTTLEAQRDSFSLILSSKTTDNNKLNKTTRFKNSLKRPLFLKGDYEVALEKIFFSNIKTTDLGHMEITYINENSERSSYVEPIMISCEMGISHKKLFEQLNSVIETYLKEREYRERLNLRRKHNIPINNNILKIGEEEISLPVKDNTIYDFDVYQEITNMCPKILYEDNKLIFRMRPEFSIKFYGNILNLIPELTGTKTNTKIPIILQNQSLPDFNNCMVFSDLIENEYFCETEYPLLKFMCLENKDRLSNHNACKTFELNDNCYKLVKKDKQLINTIKDISMTIQTNFTSEVLDFEQGEILIQLHFRKKNGNGI